MSRYELSADWTRENIILSTVAYGICFAKPDTILVFKIYFEVFGEGTRLAMPKTICTPDSIIIEAWFRGY